MTVQNLAAGAVKDVLAGEITRNVHVYRTNDGYNWDGSVGWQPVGGPVQMQDLAPGQTVSFGINGAAGMLANATPARVQLLWDNNPVANATHVREGAASKIIQQAKNLSMADGNTLPAALSKLNSQWYNAVVQGCGLDASTFQLVQGTQPIGSTSEQLWNIIDVVPPKSVSNFYNPSQANVFSSDYGAVINNLKPQNVTTFQTVLGDYYPQWVSYLTSKPSPTMPQGGIIQLFSNWAAMSGMPPGTQQAAVSAYQQVAQGVVPVAVSKWLNAGGGTGGAKAYNGTIGQLTQMLQSVHPKSYSFNTATESADVSSTWAEVEAGGLFDIFEGAGESSYSDLSAMLALSTLNISYTFGNLLTFPLGPLSNPSTDPILSQYQPWFDSAALNLAYQHQDNTVWNNNPPAWVDCFGPEGNMLRTASALVIVDGVSITIESSAAFSTDQQSKFQTAIEAGLWPFFEVETTTGWSHQAAFNAQGQVTITSNSLAGNPIILGVIVTPISGVLSSP